MERLGGRRRGPGGKWESDEEMGKKERQMGKRQR